MNETAGQAGIGVTGPTRTRGSDLAIVVLLLAVLIAYANSFTGAFAFDDLHAITENASIRSLDHIGQVLSPPPRSTVAGRPLLNLTLALNYALGELKVGGYHLVNLLIHAFAGLALFGILRRTLRLPKLNERFGRNATFLAFTISLIWLVHPIQTMAVTYIIQRAESMAALFYLLTLYAAIRAAASPRFGLWHVAAGVSCTLGVMTKEAVATAPVVVLLYDRVFLTRSWRDSFARRGVLYGLLAASWLVLIAVIRASSWRAGTVGAQVPVAWWGYAATELGVVLHYLRLCFWPSPLVLDYGWEIVKSPAGVILPGIVVLGLLGLSVLGLVKRSAAGFLGAAFFVILAPTSSVIPLMDPAFEYRMYLPLAAVVSLTVAGLYALFERYASGRNLGRSTRRMASVVAKATLVVVVVILGGLTFLRNRDYRSEVSLWEDTIRKRPHNARAYDSLGIALSRQGDHEAAIQQHTEAIRLKPDGNIAYYNRGNTYLRSGMYNEAIADYTTAIRLKREAEPFNNRAICHYALGEYDKAWADVDTSRLMGLEPHRNFINLLQGASGRTR